MFSESMDFFNSKKKDRPDTENEEKLGGGGWGCVVVLHKSWCAPQNPLSGFIKRKKSLKNLI